MKMLFVVGLLAAVAAMAVEPGGPSYVDIANTAYHNKEWAKSAEYYQKWVEAQPTDYTSWYNWACTLALNGQPEEASDVLLKSVKAGWRGRPHTERDPDLDTIRDLPKYKQALELIDKLLAVESGKESIKGLYTKQEKLTPYWVRIPANYNPEKTYPLVILLHGRGGNPRRFIKLANDLDTLNFIYAAPQAPYYIKDTQSGFQYFPSVASEDTQTFNRGAEMTVDWIEQVSTDMRERFKIEGNKVWLAGFSQGAWTAHLMGLMKPEIVAGYAAFGGWINDRFVTGERLQEMHRQGIRVYIGHGNDDQVVTLDNGEEARELLEDNRIQVSYFTYPVGHTISDPMKEDFVKWLREQNGIQH
jgi:phospholipase/carboxylesterase